MVTFTPSDLLVVPTRAQVQYEQIKEQYPEYVRAWKSMNSTYGAAMITPEWRGIVGLMKFIEDTATVQDSPTFYPGYGARLKRYNDIAAFSPDNIYWKLPAASVKRIQTELGSHRTGNISSTVVNVSTGITAPSVLATSVLNITTLKQQYPDQASMETRMEELFTRSMNHTLSPTEQAEFDILGKLVVGDRLTAPLSKFEDI